MASFKELDKAFKKDYGVTVGGQGFHYAEMKRIQTGIFTLDLALGGGLPRGKFTEIYGKEGSCKTNIALQTIATHQLLHPDKKCVWFDIEDTFDPKWAKKFGVDVDALWVYKPDYGEAMIDMIEGFLASPECGIVAIDSIAAIVTTRELAQSAEKADMGGGGLLMSKLVKKVVAGLSRARKAGHEPTFLCINQTRTKLGVMFGDPETTPGGVGKNFAASLRIRIYGKDVMEAKFNKHLPCRKDLSIILKKWKMPIVMNKCEFGMAMIPHKNLKSGQVDEWRLFFEYMVNRHKILVKAGTGKKEVWVLMGEHKFKSQTEVKEFLIKKPKLKLKIQRAIISIEKKRAAEAAEIDEAAVNAAVVEE